MGSHHSNSVVSQSFAGSLTGHDADVLIHFKDYEHYHEQEEN